MVSTDKLIKVGVKYSDKYFDDLIQYYIRTYNNNESLEEFLADLGEYGVSNPLDAGEFNDTLTNIICSSLNDIRFSRPAQKALMNNIIKQTTGELITNVGDDIRDSVRDIVRRGYNSKTLSHQKVADEISSTLTGINKKRARVIARTEIKRAQTTSNYLVSRERGANAYRYKCGGEPCSICKKDCGKTYPIDDLEHLPPRHPNCMCGVTFFKDPDLPEVKPSISHEPVATPSKSTTTKPKSTAKTKTKSKPKSTEPTMAQLKKNLTKQELEKYKWAKDVQTSEFISDKGKAKAREELKRLTQKALGNTATESKPKTKNTTQPKPTTKSTTNSNSPENMTSKELYDSMTKADKKKYDKAKSKLETVEKNIKTIGESSLLLEMKKERLLEIRQLEQKQRDKLQNKGKRKPKEKTVRIHERTLDNIHKDIDLPTEKLIPKLEKWIDKRCKNTSEFGYHFNISDGEIINGLKDGEIRGVKGRIALKDLGEKTGSIHSHPRNGMSAPSIEDLETFRCKKQNHHFMVSEHEIWYVHATDSFGIGAMGQQLDLQKAHKDCRDTAFKRVEKEIKKGEIEATEKAISEKLDEYTGDEILKTFNSPPWNKTMTVKRYYR